MFGDDRPARFSVFADDRTAARFSVVVVLPTPPFWFTELMIKILPFLGFTLDPFQGY